MTYQAPVVFRYSLLFMLGMENGEEIVVAAGNIDVSSIDEQATGGMILICIRLEWIHQWNKRSR